MQAQRVEVRMVADARQDGNQHSELPLLFRRGGAGSEGQGVFRLQMQAWQIGQHTEHRFAGVLFQPVQAGGQQCHIPTKTIDDKALDPRSLAVAQ